jgi:decaprenyl-phosphate phosphoribosyltransferase
MFYKYFILIRPHHWVKNILIFFPILLSPNEFSNTDFINSIYMFLCFCLAASGIYIFNDIRDVKNDIINVRTRYRPLAQGSIPIYIAYIISALLILLSLLLTTILIHKAVYLLLLYILINILYTLYFKYLVFLDILSVSSGFLIRLLAGGVVSEINQSLWTLLIISFASLGLATGKRLGQFVENPKYLSANWNYTLLKYVLIFCIISTIIFYGLFSFDSEVIIRHGSDKIWLTFPVIILIFIRYLYIAWHGKYVGDPTDALLKDRYLQIMALIWVILISIIFIV